ncbi:MAG: hypothetical protein GY941_26565, partial [Planctomycetes bacterium]|nr:hypothetical protein [Planctomycetota bacterium]
TNNVGDQCGSPPPPSSSCPLDSKFVTDSISGGVSYYTDRTYTITDAGPFSGMEMIKTPNDDKNNTMASDYLNYEADNSGYLYVAYDRRASSPPNWLTSTFTQIPCAMIHTSLSSQGWLDVYKRSVSFGECVSLGGNKGPGFSGGTVSNYIVLHGTVNVGDQCVTSCMLDSKFIELGWSVGSTYYTDRGYTITGVSVPDFVNCLQPLIKTPNDDRHNTQSSGYMEFEMPFNGWVYVAFDSRLTIMPSWVYDTGFVRWDGYTISTSLSSQPFMQLYTNYYSAGDCVDLGGNKAPGSSNETASNYSVFLESDGCF